ncbi:hypothetical protein FB451DRAFT_1360076 [Mycena latifolia]|nr:hypothetical protein FB451DRAFT_1360076 [Mycena latifolia]
MSSENTPILASAIPAFELFIASWKAMLNDADLRSENIGNFIRPGLAIAEKYYNKMADTDAYIIAMFINPSIRFEWICQNWTPEEQQEAKKIIMDKGGQSSLTSILCLIAFPSLNPTRSSPGASGSGSESCSRSQSRSHPATLAFTGIAQAAKRYCNVSQSLDFTATAGSTTGGQSLDDEVNHYMTSRLPSQKSTDMVGYWMNHGRMTWPKIFYLFADYTPIQATSVRSRSAFPIRTFPIGKAVLEFRETLGRRGGPQGQDCGGRLTYGYHLTCETRLEIDTTRRNRTNALLMEALQMLKFNFKRTRLNFMAEWQSAAVLDEEEDWLRILASAADGHQAEIWHILEDPKLIKHFTALLKALKACMTSLPLGDGDTNSYLLCYFGNLSIDEEGAAFTANRQWERAFQVSPEELQRRIIRGKHGLDLRKGIKGTESVKMLTQDTSIEYNTGFHILKIILRLYYTMD